MRSVKQHLTLMQSRAGAAFAERHLGVKSPALRISSSVNSLFSRAFAITALALSAMPFLSNPAHATTFADLVTGFDSMATTFGTGLVTFCYLGGLASVAWGVNAFRVAHKSEQRDAKYSHGAVYVVVGAALLALPSFAGVSVSSLFNGGTSSAPTQQSVNLQ